MTNTSSTSSSAPTAIPKPPPVYGYISAQDTTRKVSVVVIDPRTNSVVSEFVSGEGIGLDVKVASNRSAAYSTHKTGKYFSVINTATTPPSLAATIMDSRLTLRGLQIADVSNTEIWVAHENGITILDLSLSSVVEVLTFPGYKAYISIVYLPHSNEIYVGTDSDLLVIDRGSRTIKNKITLGPALSVAAFMKLTPDGTRIYANGGWTGSGPALSVIDTTIRKQIATIALRVFPSAMYSLAITPDGKRVYTPSGVMGTTSAGIAVIDVATNTITETIKHTKAITGVAIAPNNQHLYFISVDDPVSDKSTVYALDTATHAVTASIPLNVIANRIDFGPPVSSTFYTNRLLAMADSNAVEIGTFSGPKTVAVSKTPIGVAVAPEGRRAFVCNKDDDSVSVIELFNHTVVKTVPLGVGTSPLGIAISSDSAFAYVACTGTSDVRKINLHDFSVAPIGMNGMPRNVVIHPDSGFIFVSCWNKHSVAVIDPMSGMMNEILLKDPPFGMAISPLGVLFVCSVGDIKIIHTTSMKVAGEIPIGGFPFAIAISPDGRRAYVTNIGDNSVYVVELFTGVVHPPIAVGRFPFSIAMHPDGREVWVVNSTSKTITTIDTSTLTASTGGPLPSKLGEIAFANLWTLVYE